MAITAAKLRPCRAVNALFAETRSRLENISTSGAVFTLNGSSALIGRRQRGLMVLPIKLLMRLAISAIARRFWIDLASSFGVAIDRPFVARSLFLLFSFLQRSVWYMPSATSSRNVLPANGRCSQRVHDRHPLTLIRQCLRSARSFEGISAAMGTDSAPIIVHTSRRAVLLILRSTPAHEAL